MDYDQLVIVHLLRVTQPLVVLPRRKKAAMKSCLRSPHLPVLSHQEIGSKFLMPLKQTVCPEIKCAVSLMLVIPYIILIIVIRKYCLRFVLHLK